jgi:hypothetical protein
MLNWLACRSKQNSAKENEILNYLRIHAANINEEIKGDEWTAEMLNAAKQYSTDDTMMRLLGYCICESSRNEQNALLFNDVGFLKYFKKYLQKTSPCKSALVEILSATINISSVFNTANGQGPPKHMMNLIFSLLEKYQHEQDIICNAIACLTNMTRTNATGRFWTRERVKQLLNIHAWHLLNPQVSCKIAGLMHNMTMDISLSRKMIQSGVVKQIVRSICHFQRKPRKETFECIRRYCCTLLNISSFQNFFEPFLKARGIEKMRWVHNAKYLNSEEIRNMCNTVFALLHIHPEDDCSLHVAIQHGFIRTIRHLVKYSDLNTRDGFGRTSLDCALIYGSSNKLIFALAAAGSKIESISSSDLYHHFAMTPGKQEALEDGQKIFQKSERDIHDQLSPYLKSVSIRKLTLSFLAGHEIFRATRPDLASEAY